LAQPSSQGTGDLRPASDFAGLADPRARAVALFVEAGKVLQHPRCVNCHPAGDTPHQTDRMRLHRPLVVRGADVTARRRCPATPAMAAPISIPRMFQATPNGIWLRSRRRGKAARSARSASRSRTARATAPATWRRFSTTSARTRWSAGRGRPERDARRRRELRPALARSCARGPTPARPVRRLDLSEEFKRPSCDQEH